ncbi:MAG: hypothetical protein ACKVXR_09960 [Planctomycetota bacterium]
MGAGRFAAWRKAPSLGGRALIVFACLGALAACSSTQLAGSEIGSLVPQLLGIAILAWIIILLL